MDKREGGDFQNLNRNKRSLTLEPQEAGRHGGVLQRLVETADVVVENWRPDVKHRLGMDYESLAAINPRIILASISGFGQDGPYARRPGFDQMTQGMGGLMSVTGLPGQGRCAPASPVADSSAGLYRRARHVRRAAGARALGPGPVGAHLAAAGADRA